LRMASSFGWELADTGTVSPRDGALWLGVAALTVAIRLRLRGIDTPILVYPNSLPSAAADALAHDVVPTLVDLEAARAYSEAATGPCNIFVKVDVGLERLGVAGEQAVQAIRARRDVPS